MTRPELTFVRSGGAPRGPPRVGETIAVTVLLFGTVLGLLWAVGNPLQAAVAVAIASTLLVGTRAVVRHVRRRIAVRRRTGHTREVCLDRIGVCVEL